MAEQIDESKFIDGSIDETVARLFVWARRAPRGLARVEFDSEFARRDVVDRLRPRLRELDIPFHEMDLPPNRPASEVVRDLAARLESLEPGVVSLAGLHTAFSWDDPLPNSLNILNLYREPLALPPHRQIWWMTPSFTEALLRACPDLNSWFMVRLYLKEIPIPPKPRKLFPIEITWPYIDYVPRPSLARKVAADLLARLDHALQVRTDDLKITVPIGELLGLASEAVSILLGAGLSREAKTRANILKTKIQEVYCSIDDRIALLESNLRQTEEYDKKAAQITLARLYRQLAVLDFATEDWSKAEARNARSLDLSQSAGDRYEEAGARLFLAVLNMRQGRFSEGEQEFKRNLAVFQESGDQSNEAFALIHLANLYRHVDRPTDAESALNLSLRIFREIGDQSGEEIVGLNLGRVYITLGRWIEAERALFHALNCLGIAYKSLVCETLADLYEAQGRWDKAKQYALRRVEFSGLIEDPLLEGSAFLDLARLEAASGDFSAAIEHGESAMSAFERGDDFSAAEDAQKVVDEWIATRLAKSKSAETLARDSL